MTEGKISQLSQVKFYFFFLINFFLSHKLCSLLLFVLVAPLFSCGVYFNDSTKAILSPNGEAFHYVERRKIAKTDSSPSSRSSETIKEVHSLASFPRALQKKVTLLKHFSGFLVEEEKKSGKGSEMNSAKFCRKGSDDDLVFLKKWVKTRHAILFRLSNSTIQVVFFDHTEILISSEGQYIT